ncbi:MAG TPA: phosphate signaling complex protein PhoU, partial [Dehalococcoidia bacterium]|nr:phosphate signaling complex protein PhoU [Dehalococcoidia bacterium]
PSIGGCDATPRRAVNGLITASPSTHNAARPRIVLSEMRVRSSDAAARRVKKASDNVLRLLDGYDESTRRAVVEAFTEQPGDELTSMKAMPEPARADLEANLSRIRGAAIAMGEMVDRAIHRATEALTKRDVALANEVIRGDAAVNSLQAQTRKLCFAAVLTQASTERDVRELLGFQHMASELERMADHCVNIAKVARDLADLPPLSDYIDIPKLADRVAAQVRDILGALVTHDVEQAHVIAARDDVVNRLYHRLVDDLIQLMSDDPANVYRGTHLITVCQNYERIGDRVTNLAEDLVFLDSGEIEELG